MESRSRPHSGRRSAECAHSSFAGSIAAAAKAWSARSAAQQRDARPSRPYERQPQRRRQRANATEVAHRPHHSAHARACPISLRSDDEGSGEADESLNKINVSAQLGSRREQQKADAAM